MLTLNVSCTESTKLANMKCLESHFCLCSLHAVLGDTFAANRAVHYVSM